MNRGNLPGKKKYLNKKMPLFQEAFLFADVVIIVTEM